MLLRLASPTIFRFADPQELSFVASSLKDRDDGLNRLRGGAKRVDTAAVVIYGANASGKSNLADAMATMRSMVLWSQTKGEPGGSVPRRPFRLDASYLQRPSRSISTSSSTACDIITASKRPTRRSQSEWLYAFPRHHRRHCSKRDGGEFRFGRGLSGLNNLIAKIDPAQQPVFVGGSPERPRTAFKSIRVFSVDYQRSGDAAAPGQPAEEGPDRRVIDFLGKIGTGVVGFRRKEIELPEEIRKI